LKKNKVGGLISKFTGKLRHEKYGASYMAGHAGPLVYGQLAFKRCQGNSIGKE
jgi:hypothetical protein